MSVPERDREMVTVPRAAPQELVYAAWSDRWQVIGEFCVGQDEADRAVEEMRQLVRALGVPGLDEECPSPITSAPQP